MDGGTISGATVSSLFNASLRISQVVYELKAVGEQTRDLLDSTRHVSSTLQAARNLRRKKSQHLDSTEKKWIDDVLVNTDKTLESVAALIEPARVDMQTKFGSVGLLNRGLFVFRDSPKVATNLARLNLAGQSLNTAMNILCTREGPALVSPTIVEPMQKIDQGPVTRRNSKLPPTYEESEFLSRRRKSHVVKARIIEEYPLDEAVPPFRKEHSGWSEMSQVAPPLPHPCLDQTEVIAGSPSLENQPLSPSGPEVVAVQMQGSFNSRTFDPTKIDDGLIVVPPVISITEVPPMPRYHSYSNSFEGSDGLQVCDISPPLIWDQRNSEQIDPEVVNWQYSSQNPHHHQQQYQAYSVPQPQQLWQTSQQAYQAYSRQPPDQQPQHPAGSSYNFQDPNQRTHTQDLLNSKPHAATWPPAQPVEARPVSSHTNRRQSDMSFCSSPATLRSRASMASIQSSTFSEGGRMTGKERRKAWLELQSQR